MTAARCARPICSSGELARRGGLAAARLSRRRVALARRPDKAWDAPGWLPARVPGSVVDDLMRAGEVADVRFERNSRLAEWVPERAWVYRRRFSVDGERASSSSRASTTRRRSSSTASRRADHEGAFTPFSVEVGAGEHLLAVVVHAGAGERAAGRRDEPRPRAQEPHGLRLGLLPAARAPGDLAAGDPPGRRAAADVVARATLEGDTGVVRCDGELELLDGDRVARGSDELRLDRPELWWPNGLGEQRLYTLRAGGRELAIGFRTIELDGYRLTVNGKPTQIRGWNWVPLDALYGVPRPAKLAHLLELAARANVNLLRVWGGGLIETPEFYDHCDRLGLLVWQEFAQSSSGIESVPSADPRVRGARWRPRRARSCRASRTIRRSRSGAAATSSTATTRRPCSPRCATSCTSSTRAARGCRPRRSGPTTCTGRGSTRASGAQRALRRADLEAPQRVRRGGHDEPRARSRR